MGSTMANEKSQTVTFNVGGKAYEVSTSLLQSIPDTSILVQKAKDAAADHIFVDRDPDRFAYCLDYMRDNGRVYLTDHVSKSSVLDDLKFFGFDNVDDSRIQYDTTSKRQTGVRFHTNVQQLFCELENMKKEHTLLQQKIEMGKLAVHCLGASTQSAHGITGEIWVEVGKKDAFPELQGRLHLPNEAYFSECCERIGLEFIRITNNNYNPYQRVVLRIAAAVANESQS